MPYYIEEVTSTDDIRNNHSGGWTILKEEGKIGESNYKVHFKTILQTFGDTNKNKRLYTEACGQEIFNQAKSLIAENKFVGELDHPVNESIERESRVELKSVSHKFTDVWMEKNILYGKGHTIPSTYGMTMAAILKEKINVGFSLRAVGFNVEKKPDGVTLVNPPVMVVAYDCVATPSHRKAIIQEISVKEAMDYTIVCNGGICTMVKSDSILREHFELTGIDWQKYVTNYKNKNGGKCNCKQGCKNKIKNIDILVDEAFRKAFL